MEQAAAQWARLQDRHARRSRGLSHDRDVAWIAAEACDVALDPLQSRDLIQEPVVARHVSRRFGTQFRMREKAERTDAIGERYVDDTFLRQLLAAVVGHRRRADREAAAVDPDYDGHGLRAGTARRRPDVQIEAILAGGFLAEVVIDVVRAQRLNALRSRALGVIGALPWRYGLRRTPAQIADRRCRERHAEIGADTGGQLGTRDAPGLDRDWIAGIAWVAPPATGIASANAMHSAATPLSRRLIMLEAPDNLIYYARTSSLTQRSTHNLVHASSQPALPAPPWRQPDARMRALQSWRC
jgi:hypothetical protein